MLNLASTIRNHSYVPAFTRVDVAMVVAMLGLLAAMAIPPMLVPARKSDCGREGATVESGLNGALDVFRANCGTYPPMDNGGLKLLIEKPTDEALAAKWVGPYLPKASALLDPWGREFLYVFPGKHNKEGFDLSSAGPDGIPGNEDDITNWSKAN